MIVRAQGTRANGIDTNDKKAIECAEVYRRIEYGYTPLICLKFHRRLASPVNQSILFFWRRRYPSAPSRNHQRIFIILYIPFFGKT